MDIMLTAVCCSYPLSWPKVDKQQLMVIVLYTSLADIAGKETAGGNGMCSLRLISDAGGDVDFLTWKIFIFQVVVVGRFHSITPSLPVRHLETWGEL